MRSSAQVNLNAAGGRAEIAGSEQSVRVLGNARDAYALGQTQIAIGGGRTVKLADIAEVRDLYAEQRGYATQNGQQVLSFCLPARQGHLRRHRLSMARWSGCSALEARNPSVSFVELFNIVEYTEGQYHSAMEAMVEGAVLAVLVVFLFLRDWRATLISAHRHPALGDPDLLVHGPDGLHAEQPHLARARVSWQACWSTMRSSRSRISSATCAWAKPPIRRRSTRPTRSALPWSRTTFSIVAVFLPVGLMPGVSGQFFKNFGFTVVDRGADQPRRRAADHADDRGLFPQGARATPRMARAG